MNSNIGLVEIIPHTNINNKRRFSYQENGPLYYVANKRILLNHYRITTHSISIEISQCAIIPIRDWISRCR